MAVATALLIASGVGMALSAVNQWKAGASEKAVGEAQKRAAEKNAQLADYNAAVAEIQAIDAVERGAVEANRFRARTRQVVGEQRTQFAAGNIDVGYGSTLDVYEDATYLGELDALTIQNNAAREAWGYRVEAQDLTMQAKILREEGVNALAAGRARQSAARLGAIGSVVGGGASLLSTRYGFSDGGGGSRTTRSATGTPKPATVPRIKVTTGLGNIASQIPGRVNV